MTQGRNTPTNEAVIFRALLVTEKKKVHANGDSRWRQSSVEGKRAECNNTERRRCFQIKAKIVGIATKGQRPRKKREQNKI